MYTGMHYDVFWVELFAQQWDVIW